MASFGAYPPRLWARMACPHCGGRLRPAGSGADCPECRRRYPRDAGGVLDLRLQDKQNVHLEIALDPRDTAPYRFCFSEFAAPDPSASRHARRTLPRHFPAELLDALGEPHTTGLLLDLGCGQGVNRRLCEAAGFVYAGLDFDAPGAPLRGDAHRLPFLDDSFDTVVAIAVWEHLRYPLLAAREVFRVLVPGGRFIGSVAFLEPFHQNSFYHHSHLGIYNVLASAGLAVRQIGPSDNFPALVALSRGLFRRMPRRLAKALVWPLQKLHEWWWRRVPLIKGDPARNRLQRRLKFSGDFYFVAAKPVGSQRWEK